MKSRAKNSNTGFTLIELMVVISIMALLSSIVLANIVTARNKTIDTRTLQEFTNFNKAIEIYYSYHDYYPQFSSVFNDWNGDYDPVKWASFKSALQPYFDTSVEWLNKSSFYYDANADDNYQTYGVTIQVGSYSYPQDLFFGTYLNLAANDGGAFPLYYELGPQVTYCKNKYGAFSYPDNTWSINPLHTNWVCYHGD
jgi:prepilin-type N-terminal cleavage/methylation domain-containing protein